MDTKKVFRNPCCILLASLLVLTVVSGSAYAASSRGLDSSRLKLQNDIGHKLLFEFDQVKLYGNLSKQTPISDKELDELVKDTMEDLDIKSIDELNDMVDKAKRWDEVTKKDVDKFIEDLIKTINVVPPARGAGAIFETLNKMRTNNKGMEALDKSLSGYQKEAITKYLEDSSAKDLETLIKSGIDPDESLFSKHVKAYDVLKDVKGKVDNIASFAEFMELLADKYGLDQQKWKERAEGAEAKALLNQFYRELQKKIDKLKNDKKDESDWIIHFQQANGQRHDFSFFGVSGNNQIWELTMKLKQTQSTGDFSFDSKNVAGSAAGSYEGEYTIKTVSDLTAFASNPREGVLEMGIHGENLKWADQIYKTVYQGNECYAESISPGMAQSTRTLTGNCTAHVLESGEVQLDLGDGKEEIENKFTNILIEFHEVLYNQSGMHSHLALPAEIKALANENKAYINYTKGYIVALGFSDSTGAIQSNLDQGLSINVFYDDLEGEDGFYCWDDSQIWKPWDDSIKTIRIVK